jgi:hypothetical protein
VQSCVKVFFFFFFFFFFKFKNSFACCIELVGYGNIWDLKDRSKSFRLIGLLPTCSDFLFGQILSFFFWTF